MMDAKAIETFYRGYRFRSRLEARWAVFFDAVGLPFEYEKEGFVLDDHTPYLPDFWLPSLNLWVEIKPELDYVEYTLPDVESSFGSNDKKLYTCPVLDLMSRFRYSQPWPVACIIGQPGDHKTWFFGCDMSSDSAGYYEDRTAFWSVANGQVTLNIHIVCPDREIYADNLNGPALNHFTYSRDHKCIVGPIENALTQARQARFEHGEKPGVR